MRRTVWSCLAVCALGGSAAARTLYEGESQYHYIRVTQLGSVRTLEFRRSGLHYRESALDMDDANRLVLSYTKLMFAGFLFVPEPKDILMIGLGAGVCPRVMNGFLPDVRFDIIELDPAVLRVAKDHFGFAEGPRTKVMVRDGRVGVKVLARKGRKYDIVMLDAFRAGYVPYHLTTQEFLQECKQVLKPGGVLLSNLWPSLLLYEYERRTMAKVFAKQYAFGKSGNTIIVCLQQNEELNQEVLRKRAEAFTRKWTPPFDLTYLIDQMELGTGYAVEGDTLTDDYAPANVLNSIPRED